LVFVLNDLNVLKIGLTGGIASGKSVVADLFASYGCPVIDTDVLAREVVRPGTPGIAAIERAFGPQALDADGGLDRRPMRQLIFSDPSARSELEQITHPLIRARAMELIEATRADYVIIAVPLLVETDFGSLVDRVLVVDCMPEIQIMRLMARDNIDETNARAALAAQVDRETRLAVADDIVENSGDFTSTQDQVIKLHRRYLQFARDCPKGEGRAE
jgi:dephospho-CoA kinase